ncbi:hypothetical protein DYB25_006098 [Aphanomyces astaci]|uniref:Sphingomyelin phosphodiesterase 4 n=2 Tax=Aphanomyces astaci TaxID=112090 RepID=A0A397C8U6_APHAT|nr:hypothetical protein DYB36_003658 [Aphanomyces astaci]RHY38410.1 hypothetical protein DYB25_006098 [Aphanomyces astaci]RHY45612.1 hypothetical protein DYB38_011058 [Aphanomyces astaci]RHY52094.1 hypothetical protein DYB34_004754 [Aphanomyces astaci]RHY56698.1 hypothetical protein DYB30_005486 [Aphanomyces astaci]
MDNLKFDEFLHAGEPGAMSVATACAKLQKLLTTELSTPLHLHSVDSRRKFFAFFPRLLDRVFGEDVQSKNSSAWIATVPQSNGPSGDSSGAHSSSRPTSPRANQGPNAHLGEQGQAVVELFQKSLFDFVFNISHAVRFRLDLTLLPLPAQVEMRNAGAVTPLYAKLFSSPSLSVNGKNQCFMVPIQPYFLFSFLRYPVSTSKLKRPIAAAATTNASATNTSSSPPMASSTNNYWWRTSFPKEGITSLTHRHAYNVLLLAYLESFLPHGPEKLSFKSGRKQSMELFLNLLVEIWLRQNQVTYGSNDATALHHPLAVVKAIDQFTPHTDDVLCCLLITVVHVLADPHIPLLVHPSTHVVLKAIQEPLYDFFHIGFARSAPDSNPTSFCMLVDVLLAYLQPWQCVHWATSPSSPPSASYSPAYAIYVLANYHFYTTLLGVFIVHARELDWDVPTGQMLERALQVYTPELLALLAQAHAFLACQSGATSSSATTLSSAETNVLLRHLSEFGLTPYPVSLSQDFRRNAEHVLDKLQYARDTHPKPPSAALFLSSVFHTSTASASSPLPPSAADTSLDATLDRAATRLRAVFDIPSTYVVPASSFQTPLARAFSLASLDAARDSHHELTPQGRAQIRLGKRLSSVDLAVHYRGDPMLKPISSYEIPSLVRLWYKVSVAINAMLDLPPSDGFRVNLRFLAAKSNVLWLAIAIALTYALLW